MERWIEAPKAAARASLFPQLPLSDVLQERSESVQVSGPLGDLQTITIRFTGDVVPRGRAEAFKGAMFKAYAGDLVFSKIDARNGAIGLIPDSIPEAVVTSEYPVFKPNAEKLRPTYLRHLLRAKHFKSDLKRKASGTSGRKRVTPQGFLSLSIPLPTLPEQDALLAIYTESLTRAALLEQDAAELEGDARRAFEAALGIALPPALPNVPLFVGRFRNMERWSHEGSLRTTLNETAPKTEAADLASLGSVISDLPVGWSPKCLGRCAAPNEWGVLKLSAVTGGSFLDSENKALPQTTKHRPELEVLPGDVLICRGSGVTRLVGSAVLVEETRANLMICDLMFRVVFQEQSPIVPRFLAEVMGTSFVRKQIEERRTGDAPMMQKITKTALLGLSIPVPKVDVQQALIDDLATARRLAKSKRAEAALLRESAWTKFESALFIETA